MSYREQLKTIEWRNKRMEIIQRDFCCCKMCKNLSAVKNSRKIEIVVAQEVKDWYLFNYHDPVKGAIQNLFAAKEFNVINPFVSRAEMMALEMFIRENDGKDYLTGVKVKDFDWEQVFEKAREYVEDYKKKNPNIRVFGDEEHKKRMISLAEVNKDKKWLIVPGLNVHHRYYIKGRKAWEYASDVFETLCSECHKTFHAINKVPYYSESGNLILNLTACDRCGGHGFIPEFTHVQNGICFKCWGGGYEEL